MWKRLSLKDVPGVHASGTIETTGCTGLEVVLTTPEACEDLRKLLARGLNTWDDAPRWLFDLSDLASARLPPIPVEPV